MSDCSTPNSSSRRLSGIRLMALGVPLYLGGCVSVSMPTDLSLPDNSPDFRTRLYAGASIGNSTLEPDTSGTVFTVDQNGDSGTQLRLGYDVHNLLAVEVDTSVLGRATLEQVGTDVSYSAASVSALVYGLNGVQNRSRREGWSAYGRLGYSLVKRSSAVVPLETSGSQAILGLGAEYGFPNGVGVRGEITRFDTDATFVGLGAVYRFGLSPDQIGTVLAQAAEPVLSSKTTYVPSDGRSIDHAATRGARSGTVADRGSNSWSAPRDRSSNTAAKLHQASQSWTTAPSSKDVDGDGVLNAQDQCPSTGPNITVGSTGCGLFDAVLSEVTFKNGSDWLTPVARGELDRLADTLLAFPEVRVEVRAHTDSRGAADANLALSARRAEAAVAYLVSKGISEVQLEARGMGEQQPISSNETLAGQKRNRRVDLVTLPNMNPNRAIDERRLAELNASQHRGATGFGPAEPGLAAAMPIDVDLAAAQAASRQPLGFDREPVFPVMTGVKIEPLPRPVHVAGLSIDGVLEGVGFDSSSAALTPASKQVLRTVGEQLKGFPRVRVAIMAHTDGSGDAKDNQRLSEQRALSVREFLVSQGVAANRLVAEGYGESLPLVQNVTDRDKARNRRIELRILR